MRLRRKKKKEADFNFLPGGSTTTTTTTTTTTMWKGKLHEKEETRAYKRRGGEQRVY